MRNKRREKIIEIITQKDISTQEELKDSLEKAGFLVTQATVSRDIGVLGLKKVNTSFGKKKYIYEGKEKIKEIKEDDKYIRVLRDGFVSMDMAQNILVIKTVSGMAMAVAASIDALGFEEIVGTIAGDDTIMMAIRSVEDTKKCMGKFREILKAN